MRIILNQFYTECSLIRVFISVSLLILPLNYWGKFESAYKEMGNTIRKVLPRTTHLDSVTNIDWCNDGKIIHATAYANTNMNLVDPQFGVSEKALYFVRSVYFYQKINNTKDKKVRLGETSNYG